MSRTHRNRRPAHATDASHSILTEHELGTLQAISNVLVFSPLSRFCRPDRLGQKQLSPPRTQKRAPSECVRRRLHRLVYHLALYMRVLHMSMAATARKCIVTDSRLVEADHLSMAEFESETSALRTTTLCKFAMAKTKNTQRTDGDSQPGAAQSIASKDVGGVMKGQSGQGDNPG